jgi:hypothetical protein
MRSYRLRYGTKALARPGDNVSLASYQANSANYPYYGATKFGRFCLSVLFVFKRR